MPIFSLLIFWQVLLNVVKSSDGGIPFAFWKTIRSVVRSESGSALYGSPHSMSLLGAVLCDVFVDECRRWLWIRVGLWNFLDPGGPLRLGLGFLCLLRYLFGCKGLHLLELLFHAFDVVDHIFDFSWGW